jgi:hypothetical protein
MGPLHLRESIIELLMDCWELFSIQNGPAKVSHEQFIGVLNKWLEANEQPPEGCNNCPFNVSLLHTGHLAWSSRPTDRTQTASKWSDGRALSVVVQNARSPTV